MSQTTPRTTTPPAPDLTVSPSRRTPGERPGDPTRVDVAHTVTVPAAPAVVFALLADVERWPLIFPPTVHARFLERAPEGGGPERLQLWATANGGVRTWTSRRLVDPVRQRISFGQDRPVAPIAAMGGEWIVRPVAGGSEVVLTHAYSAVDDDAETLAWLEKAVDGNSRAELAALAEAARDAGTGRETGFTFRDSLRIDGTAAAVHAFLDRAEHWVERLPHVARVKLTEDLPGVQILEMDTRTADGSSHTTRSVRVCAAPHSIHYKQLVTPALLRVHTGSWLLAEDEDGGVTATAEHTVVLATDAIGRVLGPDATEEQARTFVRDALGRNSSATLRQAKAFVEGTTSA
ncbi:aromatase/cyclase [Streptomyces sp. ISL-98]|uniref:aromatase/cyclase n=1 Tax=Streptomyces sp. ISL-98 TaxID=2819192 RepID=UPI001BEA1A6F|nr:aromatase/cyclase [Streptomyces sp. ISL-98]MBT2511503.1 aromatase/cyclase [Streptomyces sp. ISL-98]